MKTELFDMVDMDYLFTVITADRAVEYTGKEVYVADSIKGLENAIKEGTTRTLEGINSTLCELRFNVHNDDCSTSAYALCVPADKVHKIEKQLRPFKTLKEIHDAGLFVGNKLTYKKNDNAVWHITEITEVVTVDGSVSMLTLGGWAFDIADLLANFVYSKDEGKTWLPFGVEE